MDSPSRGSGARVLAAVALRLTGCRLRRLGPLAVGVGHPAQPGVHVAHEQRERDGEHEEGDEAPDARPDRQVAAAAHQAPAFAVASSSSTCVSELSPSARPGAPRGLGLGRRLRLGQRPAVVGDLQVAAARERVGLGRRPETGEEVVLALDDGHVGHGRLELLDAPHPLLDLERDLEPEAVGVDLRRMRHQRAITRLEVISAGDRRRHPAGTPRLPVGQPLGIRALEALGQHGLVDRLETGLGPPAVVVDLERLPGLPRMRVAGRVTGRLERRHRDRVAHDVVGVGVATLLVVGRHDVRAPGADDAHERLGRHVDVLEGEAPVGQGRQRVALGQAGVDEAEPGVLDAEHLLRRLHLVAPHLGDVAQDVGVVLQLLVEDVAAFAARARHDHHGGAVGDVLRHRRGALARLVVGVRVHRHQPHALGHVAPCRL